MSDYKNWLPSQKLFMSTILGPKFSLENQTLVQLKKKLIKPHEQSLLCTYSRTGAHRNLETESLGLEEVIGSAGI